MSRSDALKSRGISALASFILSYIANISWVLVLHTSLDVAPIIEFAFLLVGAAALGCLFSFIEAFEQCRRQVFSAAFCAALTLWTPVIVVTYGFAIMGIPLLAIYSLSMVAGWKFGAKYRPGRAKVL